jgi:hypothetical protein
MVWHVEMKSKKETYNRFRDFVLRVQHQSPRLSNLGLAYSFDTKMRSLEIMQKHTLGKIRELFKAYEKEKNNSVYPKDVNRLLGESIAFFEAYLNAFYSFLQIVGRMTPYFFDKKKLRKTIPDGNFARQIGYFEKYPKLDPEYSSYLRSNMTWHDELLSNRNAITHNVSAFLGFGEREIVFIDMPKKRIDFFENGKPTKKLEEYILNNWNSLFEFFNFYVEHFLSREIFVDKEPELKELRKIRRKQTSK